MRSFKFLLAGALALAGVGTIAQRTLTPEAPPSPVRAESPEAAPAPPTAAPADRLTAEDVNAWLDGYMPFAIGQGDIAGAVVTVVRDGQVLTERGYGYADVESRRPVDPQRTLFRPGSVSKLVTWTAVMQQVEQGKIDLDADINRYLDFRIPDYQGQPVTMRQVMTHTAGFEEAIRDLIGNDRDTVPPFDQLLKRWVPPRIFAPGTTPAYSNWATSLAGYVVQRTSGESFDDYVDRHIFAPLGMRNSTMRQPLPENLRAHMSSGYRVASQDPIPFEIVGPAPAGSLSSTGSDMSRFMLAHLNGGELDGQRILRPETARMMHTTAAPGIGPLDRMMLGFFETNINGRRVIAHLGDTQAFHTSLHLFMDENTGLYLSLNSGGKQGASNGVRISLFEQFANRYFPGRADTRRVPENVAREHAQLMAGNWTASRRPDSTFLNISELLGQTTLSVGRNGELVTPPGVGLTGRPTRWVEVEPFVWQDLNSFQKLAAVVRDGQPVRWSFSIVSPFTVYDRPSIWKNAALVMPLAQVSLAILLITALLWPTRWLVRRYHGRTFPLTGRELLGYRLSRVGAIAIVLAVAGWATVVTVLFGDLANTAGALDALILTIQVVTFIAFLGGLAAFLWYAWQVWRGKRRWYARLWSVLLVLAGAVMVWVGFAFHLLSFGTNY
jgi:CubicO group peptidase (beta-lactamase class C family)